MHVKSLLVQRCHLCPAKFRLRISLRKHVRRVHGVEGYQVWPRSLNFYFFYFLSKIIERSLIRPEPLFGEQIFFPFFQQLSQVCL